MVLRGLVDPRHGIAPGRAVGQLQAIGEGDEQALGEAHLDTRVTAASLAALARVSRAAASSPARCCRIAIPGRLSGGNRSTFLPSMPRSASPRVANARGLSPMSTRIEAADLCVPSSHEGSPATLASRRARSIRQPASGSPAQASRLSAREFATRSMGGLTQPRSSRPGERTAPGHAAKRRTCSPRDRQRPRSSRRAALRPVGQAAPLGQGWAARTP
jgi:hypothetical protein